jgi:hypothetical protein
MATACAVTIIQLKHVMYPVGIRCVLQPDEIPLDHILIWMFVRTDQEEKMAVIV